MTMWMPLGLLALLRFCDTLRLRDALLAALCMAAQLYSSMYYGIFFPLFATAVVGTLLVFMRAPWQARTDARGRCRPGRHRAGGAAGAAVRAGAGDQGRAR